MSFIFFNIKLNCVNEYTILKKQYLNYLRNYNLAIGSCKFYFLVKKKLGT